MVVNLEVFITSDIIASDFSTSDFSVSDCQSGI